MNREYLQGVIPRFAGTRVMVIGDLMADKYLWGNASRLSPEAPVPVVRVSYEEYKLGGAANVANNVRTLGAEVYLCGIVGYDDAAHWFRKAAREVGIDTSGIFPSEHRPTTLKVRVMSIDYNQQLLRFDYESIEPFINSEFATVKKYIESYIDTVDAVILSDYDKGVFKNPALVQEVIQLTRRRKTITVVDARSTNPQLFSNTTLVTLSTHEIQELAYEPMRKRVDEICDLGSRMSKAMKSRALVIIHGEEEIFLFVKDHDRPYRFPISKTTFHDVAGMRDTIVSVLALSLHAGADFEEAGYLASIAAGKVLAKVGTATVTGDELIEALTLRKD
ncbi:MAG: hypothetical protein HY731_06700 [Candidatus Tectomicrobia bacterium]|nr:hypothetical protein [Candidatus Tectomicrobia bacterium]